MVQVHPPSQEASRLLVAGSWVGMQGKLVLYGSYFMHSVSSPCTSHHGLYSVWFEVNLLSCCWILFFFIEAWVSCAHSDCVPVQDLVRSYRSPWGQDLMLVCLMRPQLSACRTQTPFMPWWRERQEGPNPPFPLVGLGPEGCLAKVRWEEAENTERKGRAADETWDVGRQGCSGGRAEKTCGTPLFRCWIFELWIVLFV